MELEPWAVLRLFCKVFCKCEKHPTPMARVSLRFGAIVVSFKGDFMNTLPDDKVANATIAYVDVKGNPAQVEGAPVWSSSDSAVVDVVPAVDGMSAVLTPGKLGTAQVTIKADADLGAGVTEIVTLGDVEVIAGAAVSGNLTITVA